MDISPVFDWNFFWSMFYNFGAVLAPFAQILVVIGAIGLMFGIIVALFMRRKS